MSPPVIYVAGLGRCGSTLTMHMLAAAGIPCVGSAPAYEDPHVNHAAPSLAWLEGQYGKALKLLDPHHCAPLPLVTNVVIWLDRDPVEQARSQAKFAHMVGGFPKAARSHIMRIAAGLRRDRVLARDELCGGPTITLEFELILRDRRHSARKIAQFLQPWFGDLDEKAMAAVVQDRPASCAPGLDIEIEMLRRAGCLA